MSRTETLDNTKMTNGPITRIFIIICRTGAFGSASATAL